MWDVVNDAWRLFRTVLGLFGSSYQIWKWGVLLYLVWLAFSYLMVSLYRAATDALVPMCSVPFLGPQLPFCMGPLKSGRGSVNLSKITDSQGELVDVANHVGQSYDLARDMVGHSFAVRDLRIRVTTSELPRREELANELESLYRYTKETSKYVVQLL